MRSDGKEWLTTDEASRMLGVSVRSVYALIDTGDLPAYRIGSRIRLRAGDVREYLERREKGGG